MTGSPLRPCPSCARHVRATEDRCPFCAASLGDAAPAREPPASRLARAALVAFGMGTLAVASACSTSTSSGVSGGGGGDTNIAPPYGAVPIPDDGGVRAVPDAQVVPVDAADASVADAGSDAEADGGALDAGTDGEAGD